MSPELPQSTYFIVDRESMQELRQAIRVSRISGKSGCQSLSREDTSSATRLVLKGRVFYFVKRQNTFPSEMLKVNSETEIE